MNVLRMHGKVVMRELIHVTDHNNFVYSYGSHYKNIHSLSITLTKEIYYTIRTIIMLNNPTKI